MINGDQLIDVFAAYNSQIWPMQIVAYAFGIACLVLVFRKTRYSNQVISAVLAFFWLWVAFVFWLPSLLQGFTPALFFTIIFLIQGLLFLLNTIKPKLDFGMGKGIYPLGGWIFVLFALLGYPLIGALFGHTYPYMPPFGVSPCPLVTFTFGLTLLTKSKVPKALLVFPFLYALTGILWVAIGIIEDIGMIASGLFGLTLIWMRDSQSTSFQPLESPSVSNEGGWSLNLPDNK